MCVGVFWCVQIHTPYCKERVGGRWPIQLRFVYIYAIPAAFGFIHGPLQKLFLWLIIFIF